MKHLNPVTMWLATFAAVFALDLCWAYYIRALERGSALTAATWSCFLFLTAAGATISYVDNPMLLIPAVAGAFFGTLVGAIRSRKEVME